MSMRSAVSPLQNGRGILLMGLGMFLFSGIDAMAKLLTETIHPMQIVWIRNLGLVAGAVFLLARFGRPLLVSARPGIQVARGVCAVISASAFITAISYVPLADAIAVSFVAPFIVTVIGAVFLKEPVGLRRWSAVTIGFLATLIIIRPGQGAMHPAILLVLLAATFFALRQVFSRMLGQLDHSGTTVFYTAIVGLIILSVPLPFIWETPSTGREIAILTAIAVLAAIAEFMVIKALEVAESVVVAPVHYSIMIWGTIYGFVLFGQLPDGWTLVGATIIMATGLYTLHRERLADRVRKGDQKPPLEIS